MYLINLLLEIITVITVTIYRKSAPWIYFAVVVFQGRVPNQHESEEGDQEAAPGGAADCGQDPEIDDQDPPPTEGHEPAVGARDTQPRWGKQDYSSRIHRV